MRKINVCFIEMSREQNAAELLMAALQLEHYGYSYMLRAYKTLARFRA